jgi:hypothetical protein
VYESRRFRFRVATAVLRTDEGSLPSGVACWKRLSGCNARRARRHDARAVGEPCAAKAHSCSLLKPGMGCEFLLCQELII